MTPHDTSHARCLQAMSPYAPSACPVCRAKYAHLPAVSRRLVADGLSGRTEVCMRECGWLCRHALPFFGDRRPPARSPAGLSASLLCPCRQICSKLHHFLACQFPEAYTQRREETEGARRGAPPPPLACPGIPSAVEDVRSPTCPLSLSSCTTCSRGAREQLRLHRASVG